MACTRSSFATLARATPPERDRYVDFLRAASLVVVVLGHWLVAAVEYRDGAFRGANLLELQPTTQWLTWLFQVMPIFFVVGGFSNAASWSSAQRQGMSYGGWLQARVLRLGRPAAVFVLVWCAGAIVARLCGLDADALREAGALVGFPLWFLAVYPLVVALAPAAVAAHRRFGRATAVALAVAVAVVDVAHWQLHVPLLGAANFVLVWLFAHELGCCWRDGLLPGTKRGAWGFLAGGLLALLSLTGVGGYPVSMVGAGDGGRGNNTPPSLALVALGSAQLGAVLLARPRVSRWLQGQRAWAGVVLSNTTAMSLYLWHFSALVVVSAVLLPSGRFPQPPLGSAAWWALRPVWLALLALALVPLVALFSRVERWSVTPAPNAPAGPAVAAVVLLAAAMVAFTTGGLVVDGAPLGLPLRGLALLGAGLALLPLGADRRPARCPAVPEHAARK